jgi:parallel beta-helix repeat protein
MNIRMHVQGIMGLICGLALLGSLVHAPKSEAGTYYVATDGSDAHPGTEAQPFQTLGRGVRDLSPGDTLYVKNGTYAGGLAFVGMPSGASWDSPVTIAAYPGHSPVIVAQGSHAVYLVNSRYIVIDGFVIDGTGTDDSNAAFEIAWGWGGVADHIRLQNSEVLYGQSGIVAGDISDGNEFINVQVHDNVYHGIYIKSRDNIIENSSIHDNGQWGVHVYKGGTGVDNNTIRNSAIYRNGRSGWGNGIILSSGSNNQAYNNTVWDNIGGILIAYTASNTYVGGNTIYANNDWGIFIQSSSFNALIEGNNIYDNNGPAIIDEGVSTLILP